MKYTVDVAIDLPRARVIELFDDPDNMPMWQPDLVSFEHESGEPGQPGAKSKLRYKMGKREIEMIETITSRNFPDEFSGTYEAQGVWNSVANRFSEEGPEKTRWTMESEFKCSGFMRIIAFLFPGSFKKQSLKMMNQFKDFAESA